MLSTIIWTIAFVGLVGYLVYQCYQRFAVLQHLRPAARWDNVPERIRRTLKYAIGQFKFFKGPRHDITPGVIHALVFWGFLILGYQVVHMFARGWFPDFHLPLLGATGIGGPIILAKDVMELIVAICAMILLTRWLVTKPLRLMGFLPAETRLRNHSHWEAYLILVFITTICTSGLVYDAGRFVFLAGEAETEAEKMWSPVSYALSGVFATPAAATAASNAAWWIHNLVILVFVNLLPKSKHFHVITSIPNVFFSKLEPFGRLSKQDLESENAIYGTSEMRHFDWKQVLDMYSCTECGRCSSHCPATATGKRLAPRQFLLNLRDFLYAHPESVTDPNFMQKVATGEVEGAGEIIHDEVLWSCVTCRACEEACPVNIEYVDKIVDMRRHLVQEEARFPAELTRVFQGMERQSNPWGIGADKRADWAEGLDIPTLAENPDAEYLFFVGCAGSFDDRAKKITQAVAKLLKAANISFAILGRDEPCNGDTARRLGNEYLYQSMAAMAVEVLTGAEVKKVITNCPHCFNTIKNEFPQFGGNYEVQHATEVIADLIERKKLNLNGNAVGSVVFHDSCYLGRYNGVYDAPRRILEALSGVDLREPDRHKAFGMCCGAGGGRMWVEEAPDQRVNVLRVEQLLNTEAKTIASSCPYCMTMLSDGVKAKEKEEQVRNKDVLELAAEALPG
ncbi:MAG TPA: (Fe-S)-binding protein [Candidatus Limnocylindrales bacterium]|nr:(Fe-S)-binding protein [Candidatus Limnocylindrales bacterium]